MTITLKVAIIDDEADARELLKIHLRRHPQLQIVGEAEDGLSALQLLEQLKPELVLLDIQMPGHSGLEVLRRSSFIPQVIFVTAYDSFALKAFELNAIDYLLKPFTAMRFDEAIERALERNAPSLSANTLQHLYQQLQLSTPPTYPQRIAYRHGSTTEYISVTNIRFIRAADQYVQIFTTNRDYLLRQSMDALEKQLPPKKFFRTHRSAIVALADVSAIHQDEFKHYQVVLNSGESLPLSQVRRPLLVSKLKLGPF